MAIIGSNINVMDAQGIIIGSGEADRIGQIHDGAVWALTRNRSIELDVEQCRLLNGAKPGINMLLSYQKRVIGVIGVTGEPNVIRQFAQLVQMSAEMIIEQADLIEQLQWDRQHKERFINAWVKNQLSNSELQNWGDRLGIDVYLPRVVVVIELHQHSTHSTLNTNDVKQWMELLAYPERNNLVSLISFNEIVVLKEYQCDEVDGNKVESLRIDRLIKRLDAHSISHYAIALGQFFPKPSEVHLSYQSAKLVLQLGQELKPNQKKYLFEDVRLPVLLSPLQQFWQGEQITKPLNKLQEQDKSGQLMKTLKQLFICEGNLSDCASSLYIHRNTLRYRLEKIQEITGLATSNLTGLAELYLLLQITKNQ